MPSNPFLAFVPPRPYLREWREATGLSQEQFGKLAGVASATISHYEKGDRGLSVDVMLRLCEALDIQPGQFFMPPETPNPDALCKNMTAAQARQVIADIKRRRAEFGLLDEPTPKVT